MLTSLIPLITHAAALSLPVVQETANCLSIRLLICKRCSGVHQQNVCSLATEVKGPGWWWGPACLTSEGVKFTSAVASVVFVRDKVERNRNSYLLWLSEIVKLKWEDEADGMYLFFSLSDSFSWFPCLIFLPGYWGAEGGKRANLSTHSCLLVHLHMSVKYNWTPAPKEHQK